MLLTRTVLPGPFPSGGLCYGATPDKHRFAHLGGHGMDLDFGGRERGTLERWMGWGEGRMSKRGVRSCMPTSAGNPVAFLLTQAQSPTLLSRYRLVILPPYRPLPPTSCPLPTHSIHSNSHPMPIPKSIPSHLMLRYTPHSHLPLDKATQCPHCN
jgi:hypothetical protein